MEIRLDRKVALVAVFLCLIGQTGWAEVEEGAERVPEPNWIPSFDIGFDVFKYETDASVVDFVFENEQSDMPPPSDWSGEQSRSTENVVLRLGGELLGPSFDAIPGRPRLFVQGGVQITGFSGDDLFERGERGDPFRAINGIDSFNKRRQRAIKRGCLTNPHVACPVADAASFGGQGSDIDSDFQNPSWFAAFGVAFHAPLFESLLLQIKPSVVYSAEKTDLAGGITSVIELDSPPAEPETFQIIRGDAGKSTTYHSLGAGLEVGLVLFRDVRPVRTTIFLDARVMWLLSDPTTTWSDNASWSDSGGVSHEGVGSYSVTRDDFTIRAGGGVRFSWMGFGGN